MINEIKPAINDKSGLGNMEQFGTLFGGETPSSCTNMVYYLNVMSFAYDIGWRIISKEHRGTAIFDSSCNDVKVILQKGDKKVTCVFYYKPEDKDNEHLWFHRGTISYLTLAFFDVFI